MNCKTSPLAVCVFPAPEPNLARSTEHGDYLFEVLSHAGFPTCRVLADELSSSGACSLPDHVQLLITVGEGAVPGLRDWVNLGGRWLAISGACGLHDLLGAAPEEPPYVGWASGSTLGEGYLIADPGLNPLDLPPSGLHHFNGIPARAGSGSTIARVHDAHGRATERAGVTEARTGRGHAMLIAADVTGSIVRIQQGSAVALDGVPSADGTAPISDGVLKSGDGAALDWILDRQPVPGVSGLSAYLVAAADEWRLLVIRCILRLAEGIFLPLLALYPRGLPAVAHLSLDSDGNDPSLAEEMLRVTSEAGISATWCILLPGYSRPLLERIRGEGHELAMHYDAMSPGLPWSRPQFDRQRRELEELLGCRPLSNKNHYLRWEGDTELFEWCIDGGIRLDQSKGASKSGEAGYNFGTCHPHRPVDRDGRVLDVFELPTVTQDLEVFAPAALLNPLLKATLRHHGVLHLLFHPAHITKPGVADAIREAAALAEAEGMEWWTAEQLSAWLVNRREAEWQFESGAVNIQAPSPSAGVTLLAPGSDDVLVDGREHPSRIVNRWGVAMREIVLEEAPGGVRLQRVLSRP